MRYIYSNAEKLEAKPLAGTGSCVSLVQVYAAAPQTSQWKEGIKVVENINDIVKGTAIATFVDGRYPNKSTGNHAAFFISGDERGIVVVDQWKSKAAIGKRLLKRLGKDANGNYLNPSNNADAFSVIE